MGIITAIQTLRAHRVRAFGDWLGADITHASKQIDRLPLAGSNLGGKAPGRFWSKSFDDEAEIEFEQMGDLRAGATSRIGQNDPYALERAGYLGRLIDTIPEASRRRNVGWIQEQGKNFRSRRVSSGGKR